MARKTGGAAAEAIAGCQSVDSGDIDPTPWDGRPGTSGRCIFTFASSVEICYADGHWTLRPLRILGALKTRAVTIRLNHQKASYLGQT